MQIPNGLVYFQPQTKWSSAPNSSFDRIVDQVIAHRQGNPWLIQQYGLATDRAMVEQQVDEFNAEHCRVMGWTDYIQGIGDPPLPPINPQQSLGQRVAGVVSDLQKTADGVAPLLDWLGSGGIPVVAELSEKRANICAVCPANSKTALTAWFTVPLSKLIQRHLDARKDLNLKTSRDAELGVCAACACPMGLKVHTPLDVIEKHLKAETHAQLAPGCWILSRDA